jgi:hypothetical protein
MACFNKHIWNLTKLIMNLFGLWIKSFDIVVSHFRYCNHSDMSGSCNGTEKFFCKTNYRRAYIIYLFLSVTVNCWFLWLLRKYSGDTVERYLGHLAYNQGPEKPPHKIMFYNLGIRMTRIREEGQVNISVRGSRSCTILDRGSMTHNGSRSRVARN